MSKVSYQAKYEMSSAKIQFASPAVGDLDHDAYQEIVVGTSDGWVYAIKPDKSTCTTLWAFDTAAALNAHAFTPSATTIRQATTVADLDGDGWNEVIIPIGTVSEDKQNGGVVVLTHDGRQMPVWPQLTFDHYDKAYTEGVASSPAVGSHSVGADQTSGEGGQHARRGDVARICRPTLAQFQCADCLDAQRARGHPRSEWVVVRHE